MAHAPHVTSPYRHNAEGKVLLDYSHWPLFGFPLAHLLFYFSFSAKKHGADGNFFEIITSNEVHYFLQAATAEERKDWIKAVQVVAKHGK